MHIFSCVQKKPVRAWHCGSTGGWWRSNRLPLSFIHSCLHLSNSGHLLLPENVIPSANGSVYACMKLSRLPCMTIPAFIWSSKAIVDSVDPIRRRDRPASNASLDIPSKLEGNWAKDLMHANEFWIWSCLDTKPGPKSSTFWDCARLRFFALGLRVDFSKMCRNRSKSSFWSKSLRSKSFGFSLKPCALKVHRRLKVCALKVWALKVSANYALKVLV